MTYDNPGFMVPTLCPACTHRLDLQGDPPTCTSFPQGIPIDIVMGGRDHRTSRAGEAPFELDPERRGLFEQWERVNA